ncbi:MAG TPA: STAS domain-containing protein [Jatrophihabitans sp.]|nr:STAS domain-containing protein [Jatrophihabitans sp.]
MPRVDDLEVDVSTDGDGFLITISGEVDLFNEHHLVSAARSALRRTPCETLTVDLAGVTFMDCSGLAALLTVRSECEHRAAVLAITNPSSAIRHLVKLAKLDGVLHLN